MARADHIYVRRPAGYTHHGVDCGDGTVIHFTGEPGQQKINASIARTSLEEFLDGGKLLVREYGKRNDVDTTIGRAESRISETGYHLVVNNCEHFATWCCTGKPVSEQVRGVGSLTAHGAVATGAAAATSGVVAGLGVTAGLSGPGIMSGLAAAGSAVGGAASGPAVLAALPAVVSIGITNVALRDDETLPPSERASRRDGRWASVAGAGGAMAGGIGAISAAGTVSGLSGAGIASGLAGIGALAGGGMAAGTAVVVAAPAVAAAAIGTGVYLAGRKLRTRKRAEPRTPITSEVEGLQSTDKRDHSEG
ncbi:Lecithin retinol acyltransferase [Nocardioides scoriae]|uniref:Lecithin retinol acyltransferase n=1 Tax=Nocardioides scoriae TaxID=642780 RepID=A0A1H1V1F0_9ACTN|nr:lecithin retinol acyltransferase family protein [Nocardioides scoriae]SDS78607.1 Lecithin retinol acyltransferase [Nocardioides scoriae]